MEKKIATVVTKIALSKPDSKAPQEQKELIQSPRYTDALVVRVYEEDEASYECCRTY